MKNATFKAVNKMKNIILILPLVFIISCSNTQENKTARPTESKQPEVSTDTASQPPSNKAPETSSKVVAKSSPENGALAQQGSYTELFDREPKNCDFVSREILAEALQTPIETIIQGSNECTFHLEEANGNSTRFYFTIESWGNKRVLKEIGTAKKNAKDFGDNSLLSQYKISETGDTYLSMHQNRMVRILNEASDSVIVILYTAKVAPDEEDAEKRKTLKANARERTYAIANFLLKKYQN